MPLTVERVLEGISDAFVALDAEWVYLYVNRQAGELFDRAPEDLVGKHIWTEFPEAVGQPFHRAYERAMDEGRPVFIEDYMAPWDRWFENRIHPLPGGGIGIFFHEITERKRAELELERERQAHLDSSTLLDTLITAAPLGMAFVDTDLRYRQINSSLAAMNGRTVDEHLGRTVAEVVPELGDEPEQMLRAVIERGEAILDVEVTGRTLADDEREPERHWLASYYPVQPAGGAVVGVGIVVRDVTDDRRTAALLHERATRDELTGLRNRAQLVAELTELLRRDGGEHLAVLFIDLDRFKVVNDSLGHHAGDRLLRTVGDRLTRIVRVGDVVARLSGDEFAVVCRGVSDAGDALARAQHLIDTLGAAVDGEGALDVSCSIGVALSGAGQPDAETLLRDADLAMYRAKAEGRRQVRLFDSSLREQALYRHQMEQRLREALQDGRGLDVHYQPVVELRTGRLVGVEALARWNLEGVGAVTPDQFIPIAEDSGLIVALGHRVLSTACAQLATWRATLGDDAVPHVAVNLSPHQLLTGAHLVEQVRQTLHENDLPGSVLRLEITESSIVSQNGAAQSAVIALAELGIDIAVDDFGTGYSSMSYLTSLPVSTVKIDRSYVSQLDTDPRCLHVVRGVIALAGALGMRTVAEGVETQHHVEQLSFIGCDDGQGWRFSPALPADQIDTVLDAGGVIPTS